VTDALFVKVGSPKQVRGRRIVEGSGYRYIEMERPMFITECYGRHDPDKGHVLMCFEQWDGSQGMKEQP
jgi:hypothetical protein